MGLAEWLAIDRRSSIAGEEIMKDRETASFWNKPTGVLRMLVQLVVDEAAEGGMSEERADEVFEELTKNIEKQDGKPCSCDSCTNKLSMDDVAADFLDRVRLLLNRCPNDHE